MSYYSINQEDFVSGDIGFLSVVIYHNTLN